MRIRGTDRAGRAYARRLAALGLIHCETPAWVSVRDLFLPAVAAINASSYAPGIRERRPDRHSWRFAQRQDPYSAPPELAHSAAGRDAGKTGLYRPLVRVKARAPTTMKGLGEDILTELRKRDTAGHNAPVEVRNLSHRTASGHLEPKWAPCCQPL